MGIESAILIPALLSSGGGVLSSVAGAKGGQNIEGFGGDRVEDALAAAQAATTKGMGLAEDRMYNPIPYPQWDVSGMLGQTQIPGLSIPLGLDPAIQGVLDQNPYEQYNPQRPTGPVAKPRDPLAALSGPTGVEGRGEGFGSEEGMVASVEDDERALTDVSMLIQELMKKQSKRSV